MPHDELTRRDLIAASGSAGLSLVLAGCGQAGKPAPRSTAVSGSPACVLSPEQTEGPYYIDAGLLRSDITEAQQGLPLELRLDVQRVGSCDPLPGATVEVWHANALGAYSGFTAQGAGGGPPSGPPPSGSGPPESPSSPPGGARDGTDRSRFLRGAQRTGSDGRVTFHTVYPGWYQGRTTHVHVKIHAGGGVVHTGQLYFDQQVIDAVYRRPPYASHGRPKTTNASDGIYAGGGRESTLALRRDGRGYLGQLVLGVRS